jgi:hypothetical protein
MEYARDSLLGMLSGRSKNEKMRRKRTEENGEIKNTMDEHRDFRFLLTLFYDQMLRIMNFIFTTLL